MKKFFTILSIVTVAAFSANAQTGLSVGAEVGIPVGDLKDAGAKTGFGGSVKAAFPIMTQGAITASVGYLSFAGEEINLGSLGTYKPKYNMVPVKAGFRYSFNENGGFYVEPQIGYTFASVKVSGSSESEGGFTYAPSIGYLINNMVDLSLRYEGASIDGTNWSHIGFRVAYNFSLGGSK